MNNNSTLRLYWIVYFTQLSLLQISAERNCRKSHKMKWNMLTFHISTQFRIKWKKWSPLVFFSLFLHVIHCWHCFFDENSLSAVCFRLEFIISRSQQFSQLARIANYTKIDATELVRGEVDIVEIMIISTTSKLLLLLK